jgi:hypothetical protein
VIENIFATEDELYKAVSDLIQKEKADLASKEVLRYRGALWEGYSLCQQRITHNFRGLKKPPESREAFQIYLHLYWVEIINQLINFYLISIHHLVLGK